MAVQDERRILDIVKRHGSEILAARAADPEFRKLFFGLIAEAIKEAVKSGLEKLGERVEKNTTAIEGLREEMARLGERVDANTRAIKELRQEIARNREAIEELRAEVSELRQEIAKNREAIEANSRAIERNTLRLERLEKVLLDIRQALHEALGIKTERDILNILATVFPDFGFEVESRELKEDGKIVAQIDVLVRDDAMKPIEVKTTLQDRHLKEFLRKVELLKKAFPEKELKRPLVICHTARLGKDGRELVEEGLVDVLELRGVREIPLYSRKFAYIKEKLGEYFHDTRDSDSLREPRRALDVYARRG